MQQQSLYHKKEPVLEVLINAVIIWEILEAFVKELDIIMAGKDPENCC